MLKTELKNCPCCGGNAILDYGSLATYVAEKNGTEPEESETEKRLRRLEERERQMERDENFSMTGSYAGGNRDDE